MGFLFNRLYSSEWFTSPMRVFIRLLLTMAGFVLSVPSTSLAQSSEALSMDMALNAVAKRSLYLGAHDAEAAAAREMAIVARQLPDPVLRMSLDNVPVAGDMQWSLSRDFMTMQTVGLMQTFVSEGKREALSDQYEQEANLAAASRVVELAVLQRSTAQAWIDRYYQERTIELLNSQRDEAALLIETTEAAYRSGQVPQTDVFNARSEAAALNDRIKEAEIALSNAIATLERWIGESAHLPLSSLPPLRELNLQNTWDITKQAEFAWLDQQEELALAKTKVAQMNRNADWSVELMYGRRGQDFDDMVSIGISVPLQLGRKNKQNRELASSISTLESVRQLRAEKLQDYELQIHTWLSSWEGNLERLDNYDTTLLPLAQQREDAALSAYRGNTARLTDVLDARRSGIALQLERARLEKETASLWVQLRFLMPSERNDTALSQHSLDSAVNTGGQ